MVLHNSEIYISKLFKSLFLTTAWLQCGAILPDSAEAHAYMPLSHSRSFLSQAPLIYGPSIHSICYSDGFGSCCSFPLRNWQKQTSSCSHYGSWLRGSVFWGTIHRQILRVQHMDIKRTVIYCLLLSVPLGSNSNGVACMYIKQVSFVCMTSWRLASIVLWRPQLSSAEVWTTGVNVVCWMLMGWWLLWDFSRAKIHTIKLWYS